MAGKLIYDNMNNIFYLNTEEMENEEVKDLIQYLHVIAPLETTLNIRRIKNRNLLNNYNLVFYPGQNKLSLITDIGLCHLSHGKVQVKEIEDKLGFFITINTICNEK